MPIPITYALTADQCPAPPTPLANVFPSSGTPSGFEAVVPGAAGASSLLAILNRNAVRAQLAARFGGSYGICWGLELEEGEIDLKVVVTAGQAMLDAPVTREADASVDVTDEAENYVWISAGSTLSAVTDSLLPPDDTALWLFLGRVTCAEGVKTAIDRSGVLQKGQGTLPYRRTADLTLPADELPAGISLLTKTPVGSWLCDGDGAYQSVNTPTYLEKDISAGGTIVLTDEEARNEHLALTGMPLAATEVVVPLWPGKYRFWENQTPVDVTVLVDGETGITIPGGGTAGSTTSATDVVSDSASEAVPSFPSPSFADTETYVQSNFDSLRTQVNAIMSYLTGA